MARGRAFPQPETIAGRRDRCLLAAGGPGGLESCNMRQPGWASMAPWNSSVHVAVCVPFQARNYSNRLSTRANPPRTVVSNPSTDAPRDYLSQLHTGTNRYLCGSQVGHSPSGLSDRVLRYGRLPTARSAVRDIELGSHDARLLCVDSLHDVVMVYFCFLQRPPRSMLELNHCGALFSWSPLAQKRVAATRRASVRKRHLWNSSDTP